MTPLPRRFHVTLILLFLPILHAQRITVETDKGAVVGVRSRAQEFLGIPYAAPPVGPLRWKPPEPLAAWTEPRDAGSAGHVCPQVTLALFPVPGKAPGEIQGDEDCLTLNVFAPNSAAGGAKLPVIVWIHGGSFTAGAGSLYDGQAIAEKHNLIVVTLNYRLGALGFLALSGNGKGQPGASGNYGIFDQQAALKWVRNNIAAFGGDPDNVTLSGESAGGASVCAQLASPAAAGLFQKAIVQSGLCLSPANTVTAAEAAKRNVKYADKLGCAGSNLDCLRKLDPARLLQTAVPGRRPLGNLVWSPVYETPVLPLTLNTAFGQGRFHRVPVLTGTNHDEGRLFISVASPNGKPVTRLQYWGAAGLFAGAKARRILNQYPVRSYSSPALAFSTMFTDGVFSCPMQEMASQLSQYVPVYVFEFDDSKAVTTLKPPADLPGLGSFHGSSLVYFFQTPIPGVATPAAFDADQIKLSDAFSLAWVRFAENGNPNAEGDRLWRTFVPAQGNVQIFKPTGIGESEAFASKHKCSFWSGLDLR